MTTGYGRPRRAPDRARDYSRPLPPALSWTALVTFVAAFAVAWVVADLPWWIPALYGAMSMVAFAAYATDKTAARSGRRRISEQALLALGLLGGWPGGLLGQQLFRHKTRKRSFRRAFWGTVVVNVAVLAGLIAFATINGVDLELPLGMLPSWRP